MRNTKHFADWLWAGLRTDTPTDSHALWARVKSDDGTENDLAELKDALHGMLIDHRLGRKPLDDQDLALLYDVVDKAVAMPRRKRGVRPNRSNPVLETELQMHSEARYRETLGEPLTFAELADKYGFSASQTARILKNEDYIQLLNAIALDSGVKARYSSIEIERGLVRLGDLARARIDRNVAQLRELDAILDAEEAEYRARGYGAE